jgi:hypothetical protein
MSTGRRRLLLPLWGKIHDYLCLTLDYREYGKVKIHMDDYIDNMLENLPDNMNGESPTPAANQLFDVNDKPTLLPEETAQMFHHNVAKLLFLGSRARPDLQTGISFLCTKVQQPDTDDYKKLGRVMKYIVGSRDIVQSLSANGTHIMQMVGQCFFCSAPGYEELYRGHNVTGTRCNTQCIIKAEIKQQEFN